MMRQDAVLRAERAFTPGAALTIDGEPGVIRLDTLGKLSVTSGRLTVAEPWRLSGLQSGDNDVPFAYEFPRGRFAAVLSIFVPTNTRKSELPCYLRIRFSDAPLSRIAPARFADQADGDEEHLAFGTDTSCGAVLDVDGIPLLRSDRAAMEERVQQKLDDSYLGGTVVLGGDRDMTLVVFPTNGDGAYPSYVGLDQSGAATTLFIDVLACDSDFAFDYPAE